MVFYRRNYVPGGTYFFTVTLADRRSSALVDHIDVLRSAFRDTRRELHFTIDAIVVLPDHLHAVMTLPDGDPDFSKRWERIKRHMTHRLVSTGVALPRHASGEYAFWQRRFWEHTIRDETDLSRHIDYIHYNPVKHGLVTQVRNWPFSSFHGYVRNGTFPADWGGDIGTIEGRFGER